ncbi:YegS/Rv2252/BmrU family lipid kinase [Virgibacillus natechei]|uniref:YegS/Rv2252/BmrU family lipid kinase n=1 Tax=Virgibacillus natechei TaxID=1216297 RepID=A0ABS4IEP7_9BACI|nr:diacylglycerol kinase family protein [Virgibacillus natechei]MBP1968936.1 YegS/Rv2252/BmrU family lipid kinase [Virgibacillus natechei]UZD11727.1 diacylglycerol kinase family lipid kinase [Virgibacillus natechei]
MYIFIVNPEAGKGRSRRIFSRIKKHTLYQEIESSYYYTKYVGHAEEIAQRITKREDIVVTSIIVIGGDGTMHEVMNGIKNRNIPVSFIPGGSGNDFARGSAIKGNALEILQQIINAQNGHPYWLGNFKIDNRKKRFFINSLGFGFDAQVARMASKSKLKGFFDRFHIGTVNYIIALLKVLLTFKPIDLELEVNGKKRTITKCWMVTIANHPYYGGGMKIIPGAKIQPAVFPVLVLHSISKWKVLALFLSVFNGKHINFKEIELMNATHLKIISNEQLYYQVDGQTGTCQTSEISKQSDEIRIFGKAVRKAGA